MNWKAKTAFAMTAIKDICGDTTHAEGQEKQRFRKENQETTIEPWSTAMLLLFACKCVKKVGIDYNGHTPLIVDRIISTLEGYGASIYQVDPNQAKHDISKSNAAPCKKKTPGNAEVVDQ